MAKRRFRVYLVLVATMLLTAGAMLLHRQHLTRSGRDDRVPPKKYAYYRIIDEKTEKTLMTISSGPVMKGDELITEDNKLYVVVKVEGNNAYARFVEKVRLADS